MTGPGGNVGPGNLKQKIRKDYRSVSLSLSQVPDLDIKSYFVPQISKKKIAIVDFFFHKSIIDFFLMSTSATCDDDKLTVQ